MPQLAEAAHQQMLQEFKGKVLPPDHPLTRHIRRVVTRILEANNLGTLEAPDVHTRHRPATDIWAAGDVDRISPEAGGKEWHLFVVNDDKVVNAMASFGAFLDGYSKGFFYWLNAGGQAISSYSPVFYR